MKKPRIQHEVAIDCVFPHSRMIYFFSTSDAAVDFDDFGAMTKHTSEKDSYKLLVDARFDFDEVVEYIRSHEEADDGP